MLVTFLEIRALARELLISKNVFLKKNILFRTLYKDERLVPWTLNDNEFQPLNSQKYKYEVNTPFRDLRIKNCYQTFFFLLLSETHDEALYVLVPR